MDINHILGLQSIIIFCFNFLGELIQLAFNKSTSTYLCFLLFSNISFFLEDATLRLVYFQGVLVPFIGKGIQNQVMSSRPVCTDGDSLLLRTFC
jgi:hypothetical protein